MVGICLMSVESPTVRFSSAVFVEHASALGFVSSRHGIASELDGMLVWPTSPARICLSQVAKVLADTIMQYAFAERRHFRDYKAETTPDFSDIRAKVEEFEKQAKAEQEQCVDDEDEKMV